MKASCFLFHFLISYWWYGKTQLIFLSYLCLGKFSELPYSNLFLVILTDFSLDRIIHQ